MSRKLFRLFKTISNIVAFCSGFIAAFYDDNSEEILFPKFFKRAFKAAYEQLITIRHTNTFVLCIVLLTKSLIFINAWGSAI